MKTCEVKGNGKPNRNQIENLEKILSEMPGEDEIQKNADIIKSLGRSYKIKNSLSIRTWGTMCV